MVVSNMNTKMQDITVKVNNDINSKVDRIVIDVDKKLDEIVLKKQIMINSNGFKAYLLF